MVTSPSGSGNTRIRESKGMSDEINTLYMVYNKRQPGDGDNGVVSTDMQPWICLHGHAAPFDWDVGCINPPPSTSKDTGHTLQKSLRADYATAKLGRNIPKQCASKAACDGSGRGNWDRSGRSSVPWPRATPVGADCRVRIPVQVRELGSRRVRELLTTRVQLSAVGGCQPNPDGR